MGWRRMKMKGVSSREDNVENNEQSLKSRSFSDLRIPNVVTWHDIIIFQPKTWSPLPSATSSATLTPPCPSSPHLHSHLLMPQAVNLWNMSSICMSQYSRLCHIPGPQVSFVLLTDLKLTLGYFGSNSVDSVSLRLPQDHIVHIQHSSGVKDL